MINPSLLKYKRKAVFTQIRAYIYVFENGILQYLFSTIPQKDTSRAAGAQSQKKVVATASRREGVYNQTGEPSVPFCEKGAAADKASCILA